MLSKFFLRPNLVQDMHIFILEIRAANTVQEQRIDLDELTCI